MKASAKKILLPLAILAPLALIIALLALSPSYDVLIHDSDGGYYRARSLFLFRNCVVGLRDLKVHKSRAAALASEADTSDLARICLDTVRIIEVLPRQEEPDDSGLPIRHYGRFSINASGHVGKLHLFHRDGANYGVIQFPHWALGTKETLKDIRISKDTISFTRSVTTPQEMRKTGAPVYFTQRYQGTYLQGGNYIKGQYRTAQGKFLWEAKRIK
jgi:hypothetical protein